MVSAQSGPKGPPPPADWTTRLASAARVIGLGVATVSGLGLLAVTLLFLFIGVMFGEGGSKLLPALPFLALSLLPLAGAALFVAAGAPLKGERAVRRADLLGHAAMSVLFLIQPAVELLRSGIGESVARPPRAIGADTGQLPWLSGLAVGLALCHLTVAAALWRLPRMPSER